MLNEYTYWEALNINKIIMKQNINTILIQALEKNFYSSWESKWQQTAFCSKLEWFSECCYTFEHLKNIFLLCTILYDDSKRIETLFLQIHKLTWSLFKSKLYHKNFSSIQIFVFILLNLQDFASVVNNYIVLFVFFLILTQVVKLRV
jgi:hypothetical protein